MRQPRQIRKREIFWIILCLILAGAYVGQDDYVDQQVIAEAKKTAEHKRAELYARLIAYCLNGSGGLQVGDHIVDCKPRKK